MVLEMQSDQEFVTLLVQESKLVVVDFFATWCGPCHAIAPVVASLATKYTDAVFVKVDVERLRETAQHFDIRAMPTFLFFRGGMKIDSFSGANAALLEETVKKNLNAGASSAVPKITDAVPAESSLGKYTDLVDRIDMSSTYCLNERVDAKHENCYKRGQRTVDSALLRSDCDEQLLLFIPFQETLKLFSISIMGPEDEAPKRIKIYANRMNMGFEDVSSVPPVQELELSADDVQSGKEIPLKFVKLQSVYNVTIFVESNQAGGDVTAVSRVVFYGAPATGGSTNMKDLKRVAGSTGEQDH